MNHNTSLADRRLYLALVFLGTVCLMHFGPEIKHLRSLCLGDSPTVTASK